MTSDEVRDYQREHITRFLTGIGFTGTVLDYGCGAAPYRDIVEANSGIWHGFNRSDYPGGPQVDIGPDDVLHQRWDTILCTQMLQYVPYPQELLDAFQTATGRLVLTYPTNWPEVELGDLHRWTRTGMEFALMGWTIVRHEQLGAWPFGDREQMALGYGVVAECR